MSIAEQHSPGRPTERRDKAAVLQGMPRRRTPEAPVAALPAPAVPTVRCTLIELDEYEVCRGDDVLGYIDVVGSVFVARAGARRDHAVEVLQTLVWEQAVAVLAGDDPAAG
jgi:hypothetical protein